MPKFTFAQRRQIKDCLVQCRIKRLSREESQAFIRAKTQFELSIRQIDTYIKQLKMTAPKQLEDLRESRWEFLDEVFKTKDEIEQYIKEAWILFHTSQGDKYLQLNCLKELHQLTLTRSNIIDVLPHYTGVESPNLGRTKETLSPQLLESSSENTRRGQAIF